VPPPDDLSLEPVDHDPFPGQPSPSDVQSMTHQAIGPNPAKPILDALRAFMTGGLQGMANVQGMNTPEWSQRLGSILTSPEANAALGVMSPVGTKGITAFHGSPHDFDAFDISQIGTGEGAQAYGHGLYFAENEGVAQSYRSKLSDNSFRIQSPDGDSFGHKELADAVRMETNPELADDAREGWDWAFRNFAEQNGKFNTHPGKSAEFHQGYDSAKGLLQEHGFAPVEPGRMYQVSINADPEHFLDWDKPLSEQSPKVQEALRPVINQLEPGAGEGNLPKSVSGDSWLQFAENKLGREGVSKSLKEAGIPGIKYLDQGSRNVGLTFEVASNPNGSFDLIKHRLGTENVIGNYETREAANAARDAQIPQETHNYVVFDDKLIDIMKKYGIAGIGALPAMGAYHFQTDSVDHDPFSGQ